MCEYQQVNLDYEQYQSSLTHPGTHRMSKLYSLRQKLAAIFAGYLNSTGRKNHYNWFINIQNVVFNLFEYLSSRFILP